MDKETENLEPEKITSEAELPQDLSDQMDEIINKVEIDEQVGGEKSEDTETEDTGTKDSEAEDTDKDAGEGDEKDADDEYEDIDPRLVNAGRRRGWSDDKIIRLAESDPDALEALADMYERADSVGYKPQKKEEIKKEIEKIKLAELDSEALDKISQEFGSDVVDKVIRPLSENVKVAVDAIESIRSEVSGVQAKSKEDALIEKVGIINRFCDEASETFPAFGKLSKIPKDSYGNLDVNSRPYQERSRLFDTALAFEATGMSFEAAAKEALDWYKGKHAEAQVKRKVASDLNQRKKKFSARPTKKHSKKTFVNRAEQAESEMTEIYNNLGIEV